MGSELKELSIAYGLMYRHCGSDKMFLECVDDSSTPRHVFLHGSFATFFRTGSAFQLDGIPGLYSMVACHRDAFGELCVVYLPGTAIWKYSPRAYREQSEPPNGV